MVKPPSVETRQCLIDATLGLIPLDLLIRNVQIVNVYTGEIIKGAIGIKSGYVVSFNAEGLPSRALFDAEGKYAIPGFIDTHMHLDSSIVTPENLVHLVVPHGTTALFTDLWKAQM